VTHRSTCSWNSSLRRSSRSSDCESFWNTRLFQDVITSLTDRILLGQAVKPYGFGKFIRAEFLSHGSSPKGTTHAVQESVIRSPLPDTWLSQEMEKLESWRQWMIYFCNLLWSLMHCFLNSNSAVGNVMHLPNQQIIICILHRGLLSTIQWVICCKSLRNFADTWTIVMGDAPAQPANTRCKKWKILLGMLLLLSLKISNHEEVITQPPASGDASGALTLMEVAAYQLLCMEGRSHSFVTTNKFIRRRARKTIAYHAYGCTRTDILFRRN